jgi:hypothetical protein
LLYPSPQWDADIEESEEVSWSNTNTQTNTFSWTLGSQVSSSVKFSSGIGEVTMSVQASESETTTSTQTITNTNGGSKSITCETNFCSGAIYQWVMTGTAINEQYQNKANIPTGTVKQCAFACTPSETQPPVCPPEYCTYPDCQCCSAQWSAEPSNSYTICPGSPNITNPLSQVNTVP